MNLVSISYEFLSQMVVSNAEFGALVGWVTDPKQCTIGPLFGVLLYLRRFLFFLPSAKIASNPYSC